MERKIQQFYTDPDLALMTVTLMRQTVGGAVWDAAHEGSLHVSFPMITEGKLKFFARISQEAQWKVRLDRLASEGFLKEFQFDEFHVPIFFEGNELGDGTASVLHQITEVLAHAGILVTMGAAAHHEVVVAVPRTHVDDGLRALEVLKTT